MKGEKIACVPFVYIYISRRVRFRPLSFCMFLCELPRLPLFRAVLHVVFHENVASKPRVFFMQNEFLLWRSLFMAKKDDGLAMGGMMTFVVAIATKDDIWET